MYLQDTSYRFYRLYVTNKHYNMTDFFKKLKRIDSMDLYFPMMLIGIFSTGIIVSLMVYFGYIHRIDDGEPVMLYIFGFISLIMLPVCVYLTIRDINKVNI